MPTFDKSRTNARPIPREVELEPSITVNRDSFLIKSANGKYQAPSANTDRPQAVSVASQTSTATGGEKALTLDIGFGQHIWRVPFTPVVNRLAAQAASTTTTIKVLAPATYSANDFRGGKIYCPQTGEQATIISSTAASSGASMDLVVSKPFSLASTVGVLFSATPLGLTRTAVKLIATTFDAPSQVIADLTGGSLEIWDVDLRAGLVYFLVN